MLKIINQTVMNAGDLAKVNFTRASDRRSTTHLGTPRPLAARASEAWEPPVRAVTTQRTHE